MTLYAGDSQARVGAKSGGVARLGWYQDSVVSVADRQFLHSFLAGSERNCEVDWNFDSYRVSLNVTLSVN